MRRVLIGIVVLGLAACKAPVAEQANETTIAQPNTVDAVNMTAPAAPVPAATGTATEDGRLPAAFLGRWGLVPADCTSTRGDNKGLMTITADRLAFYESRATVSRLQIVSPTEVKATLAFSGEGQEWTDETPLVLEENGNVLTRTAEGQHLRYTRCAA